MCFLVDHGEVSPSLVISSNSSLKIRIFQQQIGFAKYASRSLFFLSFSSLNHRVIFKNTIITAPLNPSVWSIWAANQTNTGNAFFADFNSTGSGIQGAQRALFSTLLTAGQAAAFSISSAVGSDYATWVDTSYLS